MNNVYRNVWCEASGTWVAASEVARGRGKSGKGSKSGIARAIAAIALLGLGGSPALAQSWTSPAVNNGNSQTTVGGGNAATITGLFSVGTQGTNPTVAGYNLGTAPAGSFTFTTGPVTTANMGQYWWAPLPGQATAVTQPDPITGTNRTVTVYNNANLNFPTVATAFGFSQFTPNTANPYVDAGLGEVAATGGKLTVNVGDGVSTTNIAGNTLNLQARQTDLTYADGTGGAASQINWTSTNRITFGGNVVASGAKDGTTGGGAATRFAGAFTLTGTGSALDGSNFTVTDPGSLQTYNDTLIAAVQAGTLTQAQYNQAFAQAVPQVTSIATYNMWSDNGDHPGDRAVIGVGNLTVIHAVGANATGTLAASGALDVAGSNNGVMLGEQGATLVNNGRISVLRRDGNEGSPQGMHVDGADKTTGKATQGTNNGVISAGMWLLADGTRDPVASVLDVYGANVTNGAAFTNNGIINAGLGVIAPTATGIQVNSGGASAVNNGIINVSDAGNNVAGGVYNGVGRGVTVLNDASFTNAGTIYVGRSPQLTPGSATQDVSINGANTLSAGVLLTGTGGSVVNNGNIALGSLVQNTAGIGVQNAANFSVTNNKTISVNGGAGLAAPLPNVGLLVENSAAGTGTGAVNNGAISVAGANNVGIRVLSTGTASEVTSTKLGRVTVSGGIDPVSGTRNYGVWAEGTGAGLATANIDSAIVLQGTGAIGVHARNNAVVNVGAGASPVFQNTDQIGYFIYGPNAAVNVTNATLDASTARSTVFRIAEGAGFNGTTTNTQTGGTPLTLVASGANAVGVLGTGAGTKVETSNTVFNVSGAGATGVVVEGGASGNISTATAINLTGAGTTAAMVDGQQHDLNGAPVGAPNAATALTAATTLNSNASNVTGYVARNLGQLASSGNVTLNGANSLGIDVQQGGRLTNTGVVSVADGVGVRASGNNALVTGLGTVNVATGTAGVLLLNGAALTLAGAGDKITAGGTAAGVLLDTGAAGLTASNVVITSTGTGAGIENRAETGAIRLTDVTVNAAGGAGIRTATALDAASSNVTLNVAGSAAAPGVGFLFRNADGSNTTSNLTLGPAYTINAAGPSDIGIFAATTGDVSTVATVNMTQPGAGPALYAPNARSVVNTGTLRAADPTSLAILTGNGADNVALVGGAVRGVVATGDGSDSVALTGGTFAGAIEAGNGTGNRVRVQGVSLADTAHITNGSGAGGVLGLGGVTRNVGTLGGDNFALGTNIGRGWNLLALTDGSDVRIVGNLALSGADAGISVDKASTLRAGGSGSTAGSVADYNIANDGSVVFDSQSTQRYGGIVSGSGTLLRAAGGATVLTGANRYTGATTVDGTLRAGAANTFSAASAHTVNAGGTLDTGGFNQTVAALTNSGTVSLLGTVPGSDLVVTGKYVGNNGLLSLGTKLSDVGPSDRLVLDGANASASGSTRIQITNLGGLGARTTGNGIEVVAARNGATTTAQTTADAFTLANGTGTASSVGTQKAAAGGGHVDAGAYEYRLFSADADGKGESWYLRSEAVIPVPGQLPGSTVVQPLYRAEVPLFAALPEQLRQGNYAMLGNMHQRIGDDDVKTAPGTAGAPATGSSGSSGNRRAWGRIVSTDLNIRQSGTVNPVSDGRLTGFQAGTDVWADANWRAGVYVGQLDGTMKVTGFARGISNFAVGSNDLRSQYVGAYATYTNGDGFYADAVLQAGRHRYTVQPSLNPEVGGKGRSLLASIEVGQAFKLAESWTIEPQLQLVHQSLSINDVSIGGAQVQQSAGGGWLARAGVRVKGEIATGLGMLQPYGRFNIYRASAGTDTARFVGPAGSTDIRTRTGSTTTELAGGFTLAVSPTTSVYGELGKLVAAGGDAKVKSSVQGSLGVRVKW